jgi:membrane-associated protease RseP (regulator of RpoE activity)
MNELILALGIIAVYFIILFVLWKKKVLEKYNLSLIGPLIMWRTKKGRGFIDKIAKHKRFWHFYGNLSIWICGIAMVMIMLLLIWIATLVPSIPAESAPTPQMIIGIPGLNPLIPLGYGVVGLIVAVLIHEFSHGILSRAGKIKLKSLGILICIIPIGAFTEPDEEELAKVEKRKRGRVYAAGPASNIILGVVCAVIFSSIFMSCVKPAHEGVAIIDIVPDSPASNDLTIGMIITNVNGTAITNSSNFDNAMSLTKANQTISITVYAKNLSPNEDTYEVVLANRYEYTGKEEDQGRGYLGVYTTSMERILNYYHPLSTTKTFSDVGRSMLFYLSLPIMGLSPIQDPTTNFYTIGSFFSFMPEPIFWTLANCFYWLFWINMMVGLTNALPAVPLDGGYLFKDGLDWLISKVKSGLKKEKREEYVSTASFLLALFVLALILWQLIGPRI